MTSYITGFGIEKFIRDWNFPEWKHFFYACSHIGSYGAFPEKNATFLLSFLRFDVGKGQKSKCNTLFSAWP